MFANPIELFKLLGMCFVLCVILGLIIKNFRRVIKFKYHYDSRSLYRKYPLLQPLSFKGDVGWREIEFRETLRTRKSKLCEKKTRRVDDYTDISCYDETWYVVTSSDELVSVPVGEQLAKYLTGDWKYVVLNRYYNGEDVEIGESSKITIYFRTSAC